MKTEAGGFLAFRQVLSHVYSGMFDELLERYDLTQMEINILLLLANNPQHDTAAEFIRCCGLSKSQVSTAVDNLATRGYVQRRLEGRRIHLSLLPAADTVIREGRLCQIRFGDVILEGFTKEERAQLNELLRKLICNARAAEKKMD